MELVGPDLCIQATIRHGASSVFSLPFSIPVGSYTVYTISSRFTRRLVWSLRRKGVFYYQSHVLWYKMCWKPHLSLRETKSWCPFSKMAEDLVLAGKLLLPSAQFFFSWTYCGDIGKYNFIGFRCIILISSPVYCTVCYHPKSSFLSSPFIPPLFSSTSY